MNFDFPAILVLATLVTGVIWLIDALFFASRRREAASNGLAVEQQGGAAAPAVKEPLIVEYARSFFPVILAVLLLRSFLVEPFRIPSGSMMPTLLVGDFILVNKFAYGLRWPVLNTKFVEIGEPERGDVVVFRFPRDPSIDYIKRVVAVPGDTIDYRNKTLHINGDPIEKTSLGTYEGVGAGRRMTGAALFEENLTGVEHQILVNPRAPDLPPGCRELAYGPREIPPGQYFVMGDNRDNSNDSRCWGLVPEGNLVGQAFGIWMNWDGQTSDTWYDLFSKIDWGRIGRGID